MTTTTLTHPAQIASLQAQLQTLLTSHDPLVVAELLQTLFNAMPSDQRKGYRCEVRLLSQSYQSGGFD